MNSLVNFNFESKPIRIAEINGEPWFIVRDLCDALGYGNHRQAASTHVDPMDVQMLDTPTTGGIQRLNYVNESGLYALIFGSTKTEAKRFKRWVTSEVLPSIRNNGGYIVGQESDDPELILAKALQVAQNVIQRKSIELQQAHEVIAIQTPKAVFVDNFTQRESLQNASQVAQTMGMSAIKMNRLLDEIGGIYSKSIKRSRVFCQPWIDKGYGRMIQSETGHSQAMFTTAGVYRVTQIMTSEGVAA